MMQRNPAKIPHIDLINDYFEHIFVDKNYEVKSEERAIQELDELLLVVPKELFLKNYDGYFTFPFYGDVDIKSTLVATLIENKRINLAKKFIEIGVNTELGEIEGDSNKSPLRIALESRNIEMVHFLLDHAKMPIPKSFRINILLRKTNDANLINKILQIAENNGCLDNLLQTDADDGPGVFHYFTFTKNLKIIQRLMNLPEWQKYSKPNKFLAEARKISWTSPAEFQEWNDICVRTRKYTKRYPAINMQVGKNISSLSLSAAYDQLFDQNKDMNKPANKAEAIKYVLAQVHQLLADPRRCMSHLQFLNKKFERYLQETESNFSLSLDHSTYSFKPINDLWYPIPHANFSGHHKNNLLDKFLISFFEQHGLKGQSLQWIGFIPHKVADPQVARGDYVKENIYGAGLFHGTYSHELQKAIFICAIDNNDIDLSYQENGERKLVTLKDLLEAFVKVSYHHTLDTVWTYIRDRRYYTLISFTDPFRLHAFIMQEGPKYGMHLLSYYSIDSFCKGFQKLYDAHCQLIRKTELETFIEELGDLQIHVFPSSSELVTYAIKIQKEKSRSLLSVNEERKDTEGGQVYAVVSREYQLPKITRSAVASTTRSRSLKWAQSELTLFNQVTNQHLEQNRFYNDDAQREYDKRYGMVKVR